MTDELMSVLSAAADEIDETGPRMDDRALEELNETLVLVRELDAQLTRQQEEGRFGLWVPAGEATPVAAGAAAALRSGDWLYPSFRDWPAYLVRGGSLRHLVAQAFGSASDPQLGRQLPGQPSLDGGRYVPPTAALGAGLLRAAGTAVSMSLQGAETVSLATCGAGVAEQPAFWMSLQTAARHDAPLVVVCRVAPDSQLRAAERAAALDWATERIEGADPLAVIRSVTEARERAVAGRGPTLVEAVIDTDADPIGLLHPYLEHRGLSDPGRAADLEQRSRESVAEAIEVARAEGAAAAEHAYRDVTAERSWMLQEQSQAVGGEET